MCLLNICIFPSVSCLIISFTHFFFSLCLFATCLLESVKPALRWDFTGGGVIPLTEVVKSSEYLK